MRESEISKRIMIAASNIGARLFRNTVGQAIVGKVTSVNTNRVMVERPKRITMGLGTGSSDLVGWRTVVVTSEMVGRSIAQFVAIEVKRPGEKATAEQTKFLMNVSKAGGLAILGNDPDTVASDLRTGL